MICCFAALLLCYSALPRILHISTRLILGGSQENTVLSCEGQSRLGHEVHLAFGPIYGPGGSLLYRVHGFNKRCASGEETTTDGRACAPIKTHTIPHLIRDLNPRSDFRAYSELKELIRDLKPDIVHTHSSKAGILGRAAAWAVAKSPNREVAESPNRQIGKSPDRQIIRKAGEPLDLPAPSATCRPADLPTSRSDDLTTSRSSPAILHTIHGPPFMPLEGSPFRRLKIGALNTIYELAERFAARRCHTIISVADAMTRQFLARNIGHPDQYVTVHSGMETEPYLAPARGESRAEMRSRLGFSDSDIVIGTVARLAEHKGHDDLLDALAHDLKSSPNLKLLWVGDGWWRTRLLEKAAALGLTIRELDLKLDTVTHHPDAPPDRSPALRPAHLTLTGLVPPTLIPAHIRAMDILAHPSYREGLPRTIPQALLCGIPPVAYDIDGTSEVCQNNQTGRLIATPGDRAALRQAILDLAADSVKRAALATRGRELCRTRFSARTMVDRLEEVYAVALQRASG